MIPHFYVCIGCFSRWVHPIGQADKSGGQKLSESEGVRIPILANLGPILKVSEPEGVRILGYRKVSEWKGARIFQNLKVSESECVRISYHWKI